MLVVTSWKKFHTPAAANRTCSESVLLLENFNMPFWLLMFCPILWNCKSSFQSKGSVPLLISIFFSTEEFNAPKILSIYFLSTHRERKIWASCERWGNRDKMRIINLPMTTQKVCGGAYNWIYITTISGQPFNHTALLLLSELLVLKCLLPDQSTELVIRASESAILLQTAFQIVHPTSCFYQHRKVQKD